MTIANEQDYDKIAQMAKIIWNKHYISIISQAQIDYMLEHMNSVPSIKEQVTQGREFYLLQHKQQEFGFVAVEQQQNGILFLHKFYIMLNNGSKGLGSKVMQEIKNSYAHQLAIKLTVNRQNFKAINFYFKNGFKIVEVADFKIGNGYEMNDFVMQWQRT